ncbi:MAG: alkaline phosphatase family protein [Candidatus Woesearchaeota archaeon]
MEKNKRKRRLTGIMLIATATLLLALPMITLLWKEAKKNEDAHYKRVLVIGIDGMDYRIAKTMIEQGKLPNFKRLSEQGGFRMLTPENPAQSPVVWTSIATGKNPGKHGVFDYVIREPETYILKVGLFSTDYGLFGTTYKSAVKSDAFWKQCDCRATIIRWPLTFPPEKIKGSMLSGLGVPDIKGYLSGYTFYTEKNTKKPEKTTNKIVIVKPEDGKISTHIAGPVFNGLTETSQLSAPMSITINEKSIVLDIDGKEYSIKEKRWSDWIEVSFGKADSKIKGMFKVYLIRTTPFEMYVTAVQINPKRPLLPISYPNEYSTYLAEKVGLFYTLGQSEETDGFDDGFLPEEALAEQIKEIENEREKIFWSEFEKFEEGIFAIVFDSSDRLQHVLSQKSVEEYYMEKDIFLGKVLDSIKSDTLILVFSDHGISNYNKSVNLNAWLVKNGYMSLRESSQDESSIAMYSKNKKAPYYNVNWNETIAYSVGFTGIYINQKGREKNGIVEPSGKDDILNEISAKLTSLKDPVTGEQVVAKVYKSKDIYFGDQVLYSPDLVVGFMPGYRTSTESAIGLTSEEVISNNRREWRRDHIIDPSFVPGVLFSNARVEDATARDIAPTILYALGKKIPKDIDGRVLIK